jgi:uncharacterized protein YndB with AHSA1/START domain
VETFDLEAAVHVDAPPERVWDSVADVTRMGEWSPECFACRWLGRRRPPGRGARFVGFNRRKWVVWCTTAVVEEAERGVVFGFRIQQTGAVWTYRFAAENGGTRLTETRRLTRGRTRLIQAFAGTLLGGADAHDDELLDGMRQTLQRIKSATEAGQTA